MYSTPGTQQGSPAWRRRLGRLAGVAAVGGAVLLGAAPHASAVGSDDAPVIINQLMNDISLDDTGGAEELRFELKPVFISSISSSSTSGDDSPIDIASFSFGSESQGSF